MADLNPITRQEKIIAGEDIQPVTRLEHFLKNYGGGSGGGVSLYEHRLSIASNDPSVQGRNISVYVNVITASSTPITDYTTLINTLLGTGNSAIYACSGQVSDYGDYSGRPTFYLATRFQVHQNNFDGNIQNTIQIAFASYTDMGIQENQCMLGEERFYAQDNIRQIC